MLDSDGARAGGTVHGARRQERRTLQLPAPDGGATGVGALQSRSVGIERGKRVRKVIHRGGGWMVEDRYNSKAGENCRLSTVRKTKSNRKLEGVRLASMALNQQRF